MTKEKFIRPLSLEFLLASAFALIAFACDEAGFHSILMAWLCCITGTGISIHALSRTRLKARSKIAGYVLVISLWLGFGLFLQHHNSSKNSHERVLDIIQPLQFNGKIEPGDRPVLLVNVVNQTGDVVKTRLAKSVFIVPTPTNFSYRLAFEARMWNHLEENYKNRGLDQDLPARGEGVSNLTITDPDPLTEQESRGIADGTLTLYFLSVTRNRETQEDLIAVCAYIGTQGSVRLCGEHNLP